MINYNTQAMHTVGKTIQTNGQELQGDLQSFWSFYQTDMQTTGFQAFVSCLSNFMNLCQKASQMLAQNRINLGTKLDQAATAAEQTEAAIKKSYRGHMMPQ